MIRVLTPRKIVSVISLSFLIIITGYFIIDRFTRYAGFNEALYTPYFWPRKYWVFAHLVAGSTALISGPLQFIGRFRKKYMELHRRIGKIYLVSVATGGIAGFYMACTSHINMVYMTGLIGLSVVWLGCGTLAFIAILNRNIAQHREWMIRTYVVTFSFITFRVFADGMAYLGIGDFKSRLALMSWACWAGPFIITEMVLQGKKIRKQQR